MYVEYYESFGSVGLQEKSWNDRGTYRVLLSGRARVSDF